jgi:hypothetical protein
MNSMVMRGTMRRKEVESLLALECTSMVHNDLIHRAKRHDMFDEMKRRNDTWTVKILNEK